MGYSLWSYATREPSGEIRLDYHLFGGQSGSSQGLPHLKCFELTPFEGRRAGQERHRSAEDFRKELLRMINYEQCHAVLVKSKANTKAKAAPKKENTPLSKLKFAKAAGKDVKKEVKEEVEVITLD